MKKYPAYKDSGIEWIGEIPEHWEVDRLQNIGRFSASGIDKKINPDEPLVSMVNYMDIYGNASREISSARTLMQVSCSADKILSCNLCKGDLVFTPSSETKEDIGLSALITEDLDNTVFSYHTVRFRFIKEFYHRYKKYLCNNHFVLNQFSLSSKGTTRQILVRDDFKNIRVLVPSSKEQQVIADYLDRKTTLIDELIDKKQRQIELLNEQRQAVINQAITKGLDSDVEMKDSGIYWLGNVPKPWAIKKFSYCTTIRSGQVDPSIEPYCDMTLIAPNHIESKTGQVINTETAKEQGADSGKYLFEEGEVLYSKIRPHLQKVCVAPLDGICSADMYAIKPTDELLNTFLAYFMLTEVFTAYTIDKSMRVAMPKINRDDLTKSFVAFPDKCEQKAIVEYIETEKTKINQSIVKAKKQIQLLQEYRTALISEAVTGKIDVREN